MTRRAVVLSIMLVASLRSVCAQPVDVPFQDLLDIAQAKEATWKEADEEWHRRRASLQPCDPETSQLNRETWKRAEDALAATLKYYRAWQDQVRSIHNHRLSSQKQSAEELGRIRSSLELTRKETAALQKRYANVAANAGDEQAGLLARLKALIEAAEASERQWVQVLREFESEAPAARAGLAKSGALVQSLADTIERVKLSRRSYELYYLGRNDRIRAYCPDSQANAR